MIRILYMPVSQTPSLLGVRNPCPRITHAFMHLVVICLMPRNNHVYHPCATLPKDVASMPLSMFSPCIRVSLYRANFFTRDRS